MSTKQPRQRAATVRERVKHEPGLTPGFANAPGPDRVDAAAAPAVRTSPTASQSRLVMLIALLLWLASPALAQREVKFPPAESEPPPSLKSPPRAKINPGSGGSAGPRSRLPSINAPPGSGGLSGALPQRQRQRRESPPPTSLTVMYKLRYGETLKYRYPDGRVQTFEQWQSYQDDGHQIIRYANERLADGNNYRYATVPLSASGFDPRDIPILYMTGDYDFVLSEQEVINLRRYLLDGGTIIFNAARGRDAFSTAVVEQMLRVLPNKTFMKMPPDHPVFNNRYRIRQSLMMVNGVRFTRAPELFSVDLGTRAAAILVPGGLGAAWSDEEYHPRGKHIIGESAIRLGVNLVGYVLGGTEYGRFLAQEFPTYNAQTAEGDVLRFALARYAGSWNVNPALQNTLMKGIADNTGIDVDYTPHFVDLDDPGLGEYPLVLMTGHYAFRFRDSEIENLRDYLRRGGTLLASAAAGFEPFDRSFRREIQRVLPQAELVRLPPSHPMFASGWNPIERVEYTAPALRDDPTLRYPEFYGLFLDQRLVVIYTPYDLFSGVNQESNAYAKGLTPQDALRVCVNAITHAMSH